MDHTKLKFIALVAAAAILSSGPAFAQKSKDTLRVGYYQPIRSVNPNYFPSPESITLGNAVFDSLIIFDAKARKIRPLLAKSWKRIDAKTLEFKLRDDVKFQDGSEFDADDVVFTINLAIDPKAKFPLKGSRFGWIAGAQKIDKYTVRIKSKRPTASDLNRLAGPIVIYPNSVLPADKMISPAFGKAPIGTGPYRVTQVNTSRGVVMVRNDKYNIGSKWKPAASIGKVVIQSIADQQTQVARLLAGEQDLVYDVEAELAKSLAARPGIKVDIQPAVGFNFIYFDTADLSGVGVFKNKLVRKALLHAINRNDLRKALLPEKIQSEPLQQAMCNPWHIGCDSSVSPPQYDPALAKRLLAQAGYPNGFKLELTTWGPSRRVTEAVAGMLRKVGVITSVDALTIGTFRKKLRQNKIQATVSLWDNGVGQPDVDITMGFFFLSPNSKLMGDNSFKKMVFAGVKEHELDKRKAVYRKIFNRVTNEYYMMPLIQIPVVVAHHTDVKLILGHKNPHGLLFNWTAWN